MNTLLLAAIVSVAVAAPRQSRLGDNLWMWGHDTGHYDGPVNYARHDYKIPWSAPITMADACVEMGIPNCCVIRPGMPPPEDDYLTQFSKLSGISWLLWKSTREYCLEKAVRIPNIKAFDLDDFFMENNPFNLFGVQTKTVKLEDPLRQTERTYVIYYDVVLYERGSYRSTERYSALVTLDFFNGVPESNPLGIYITDFDIKKVESKTTGEFE